jgi:serine/threonine protein kinase
MIMAIVISLGAVCLITICGVYFIRYRNHKQDQQWLVNVEELQFDDPVEVIGQGSFGVVLLGEYRGTKVALKRALKANAGGSKKGSRRGSRASATKKYGSSKGTSSMGSSGRGSNPTDSVGLSSAGMSSQASSENEEVDPEIGEEQSAGTGSQQSSVASASVGLGNQSASRGKSSSRNSRSLGFLEEDFGKRHKWSWLFPWLKKNGQHSQFKAIILGSSGGTNLSTKSWHARWMPCFSAQVRAEEAFIAEMRVLARLRHPNITTVLGAVISSSHDPMLVSK